jgi:hypothetical protein
VLRVDVELGDKAEWVKMFDPRDSTIFVASHDPPAIGEQIRVDLVVGPSGPKVILRGKVVARRVKGDGSLLKGFTLALGAEEREKINYLNGFVRGGLLNLRERRRLPVRLRVTYGGIKGPCDSFTRDINEEGVFIITADPLPEESEVHLLIIFPGKTEPMSLAGVVQHTVVVEDEDIPGMGIRFKFQRGELESFVKLIDELDERFRRADLPEEYLI